MGFRVESYKRDELRKIALPGQAISTLFWVLPIGNWRMGELDRWWDHFTRSQGLCQEIGLLLVRDHVNRNARTDTDTANLSKDLAEADGGSLFDLIPEAGNHWGGHDDFKAEGKSILVLSGAYPQPGWGVLIPIGGRMDNPRKFERLLQETVRSLCEPEELEPIRRAAEAYHMRHNANHGRPPKPRPSRGLDDLREASSILNDLFSQVESGTSPSRLASAFAKARRTLSKPLDLKAQVSESFWIDLNGRVNLLAEVAAATQTDAESIVSMVAKFDECPEEGRDVYLAETDRKQASFLKKIRFLRKSWPDIDIARLQQFLDTVYRPAMTECVEEGIGAAKAEIETKLADLLVRAETEQIRYQEALISWQDRMRTAEATFRTLLPEASIAQWRLGPAFLVNLEKQCAPLGLPARSVPWDPARMIGWKLHVLNPGIDPQDLLVAANTVLDTNINQFESPTCSTEFNGSLFADYAYFVSISAKRLPPWEATKRLLSEVLSPSQFRKLIEETSDDELVASSTKDQLAKQLIQRWGWIKGHSDIPRSLAACIHHETDGKPALSKSLNATRTSFEGFLKDLVRISFATLGWSDVEIEEQLPVHCPNFRRNTNGSWNQEMQRLTSGSSLILLRDLLRLGFPQAETRGDAESFCSACSRLLKELNKGSHDPPPPPPTKEMLAEYGEALQSILRRVDDIIGEMPWHLSPDQSFGNDPVIVTGHAWSHSHIEERMIRVMLWAGDKHARELLVWNKALTNPVMTDAILL